MMALEKVCTEIPVLMRNIVDDPKVLNISIIEGVDDSQEKFFIFNSIKLAPIVKMIHIFY